MTNDERQILKQFNSGSISKDEVMKLYPIDLQSDVASDHVFSLIKKAFENQDGSDFDLALNLIVFVPNIAYTDEFVGLLCKSLKGHWHRRHEDIALMLESIKSPKSVDTLYETALTKFDYLDYDNSIPLAIKCIYALGEINTENSKAKLKLLTDSSDLLIREEAKKQLSQI